VGMVVRKGRELYLWHSADKPLKGSSNNTYYVINDEYSQKPKSGPQLNKLKDALSIYKGEFVVMKLRKTGNGGYYEITPSLEKYMTHISKKPYEDKPCQLFLAAYDGPFGENKIDHSGLFCSELFIDTYKHMGLVQKNVIDSEFTPADLSRGLSYFLRSGWRLGDTITRIIV